MGHVEFCPGIQHANKKPINLRVLSGLAVQYDPDNPVNPVKTLFSSLPSVKRNIDYEEALALADDDINENWALYRDRFLRGGFP